MEKIDLITVSSYPEKGLVHGQKTVGVASYAKNTLLALSKASKIKPKIVVLAEKLKGQSSKYQEKNITVRRCWQRNSSLAFFQILKEIRKHKTKQILIEFEMAMFGNPLLNIFFPFFLLVLKLLGKKTTVVIHQVVLDFTQISGHLGQSQKSLKTKIMSFLAKIFFFLVVNLADQIIVFEEFIKDRLNKMVKTNKIVVIPHGVEISQTKIKPEQAKEKLGFAKNDFVITIFGFLAWYKGTDWLVNTFSEYLEKNRKSNFKLVLTGGPNPNHLNKEYYLKYLEQIKSVVKRHPGKIKLTGFIKEKEIPLYYRSSDLLVFPYRTSMSSSGPLAIAFTNQRPFLVSRSLADILETNDITHCLKKLGLTKKELSFPLEKKSFWKKVKNIQANSQKKGKIIQLGKEITLKREWSKIGQAYAKTLLKNK